MDVCSYCQRSYSNSFDFKHKSIYPTIDHIIPLNSFDRIISCKKVRRALYNKTTLPMNMPNNLILCCNQCNQLKRSMSLLEFKYYIQDCLFETNKYHSYYINIIKTLDLMLNNALEICLDKNK